MHNITQLPLINPPGNVDMSTSLFSSLNQPIFKYKCVASWDCSTIEGHRNNCACALGENWKVQVFNCTIHVVFQHCEVHSCSFKHM